MEETPVETLVGPYRPMELRFRGPTGDVWLAWDTRLNQRVELTVFPPPADLPEPDRYHRAFVERARALSDLRHPALLTPVGFARADDPGEWYTTEDPPGIPVAQLLDGLGRLAWRQATMILHEVASAIAFLHEHAIPHAHVRSTTVRIDMSGNVVLTRVDLAGHVLAGALGPGRADPARIWDDLLVLAPETLQRRVPSAAGDLFSLGVLAFELLTGQRPFSTPGAITAYAQSRRSAPDPGDTVRDIPADLRQLVTILLAARPELRPGSAGRVRDELQTILRRTGVSDARTGLRQELARQRRIFAGDAETVVSRRATEPRLPVKKRETWRLALGLLGAPAKKEGEADAAGAAPRGRETEPRLRRFGKGTKGRGTEPILTSKGASNGARRADTQDIVVRSSKDRRDTSELGSGARGPKGAEAILREIEGEWASRDAAPGPGPRRRRGALLALAVALAASAGAWAALLEETNPPPALSRAVEGRAVQPRPKVERPEPPPPAGVASPPPPDAAIGLVLKSAAFLRDGLAVEAENLAREAIRLGDGGDPDAHFALGEALAAQGKVDAAVEAYARSSELGFGAVEGHLAAARLLVSSERHAEALDHVDAAARFGEDRAELHLLAGLAHGAIGRHEESRDALLRSISRGDADAGVLVLLARAHERTGERAKALRRYEEALAKDPAREDARLAVARLSATGGDAGRALAELGRIAGGDDAATLEVKGHAAFAAGRWAEAAAAFGRSVEIAGAAAGAGLLRNHAVALDRSGRAREALRAYERAIEAAPEDGEVAWLLGRLLRKHGKDEAASRWLVRAARLDPRRWEAYFDLGLAELALGRPKRAEKAFRAVVARRPTDTAALQNLAKARVEAGMSEEAVRAFERLATLRPDDPGPVLTMAALMQRMDRPAEAAAYLKMACRRGAKEACR